jgi:hypothetical protein
MGRWLSSEREGVDDEHTAEVLQDGTNDSSLFLCVAVSLFPVSLSFCLSVFLLFYLSVSSSGYISTNITVCHQCAGDTRLAVRRPRELVLNVTADCGAA